ncbi:MAG: Hpt domain-containing protein [Pseudomonadales bacterium]|nr:Hpt domain-containing protein [Pseudomonadales bacterium]
MESTQHIDEAVLSELEEIMEDEFGVLLETYLTDAVVRLDSLDAAMDSSDVDLLRESAHSLKGSSSNIGAVQLSGLCASIENLARENQLTEAATVVPGARVEYQKVRQLLEQRIN